MLTRRQKCMVVTGALLCSAASLTACAQARYPDRPIRIIVPLAPGGGSDYTARYIGQRLADRVGQAVVVDNRPAASGIVGTDMVAKAVPDGYTLLLAYSTHAQSAQLFEKLPYDPIKDFAPVTLITATPFMLGIHPSVAASSVSELVALARSKPGALNYGSSGAGSSIHLTTELLKSAANLQMTHVPYKGSGPAFIDLIGGQIQMLFSSTVSTMPHVKSGKVRGLAITSLKRAPALPEIPTIAESYPGFESSSWFGLLVPAKTPQPVMDRLLKETRAALKSPDVNQALVSQGAEPGGSSPTEFGAYFQTEIGKWAKVIKSAGIKLEQ